MMFISVCTGENYLHPYCFPAIYRVGSCSKTVRVEMPNSQILSVMLILSAKRYVCEDISWKHKLGVEEKSTLPTAVDIALSWQPRHRKVQGKSNGASVYSTFLLAAECICIVTAASLAFQCEASIPVVSKNPTGLQHQLGTSEGPSFMEWAAAGFFPTPVHTGPLLDHLPHSKHVNQILRIST